MTLIKKWQPLDTILYRTKPADCSIKMEEAT